MVTARQLLSAGPDCIVRSERAAQIQMTELVGTCFAEETAGVTLCEAGTGTGKSIAYMVPVLLSGMRCVVSTATKALQKQVFEKDVPYLVEKLKRHLPVVPAVALLKGKGNYVCRLRLEEAQQTDQFQRLASYEREPFVAWALESPTGDLSDLPKPFALESMVKVTECVRSGCPHAERCGYVKLKDKAASSPIVIVNHALVAHDIALGGGSILGEYKALVLDEAHKAPRYIRDALSLRIHHKQPEAIERLLGQSDFAMPDIFGHIYGEIFKRLPGKSENLNIQANQLQVYLQDLYDVTSRAVERMKGRGLLTEDEGGGEGNADVARAKAKLRTGAELVNKVRRAAEICLDKHVEVDEEGGVISGGELDYLCYVDAYGRGTVPEIAITPLEIGPIVGPVLTSIKRVFITSATLSANNDFSYIRREFGLNQKEVKHSVILPHTFQYPKLACAYVSGTSPDPSSKDDSYYDLMAAEIHELLVASRGGALVLCASNEDINKLHQTIRNGFMNEINYNMGVQFGPPEPLIEWFKKTPNPVLFGVKTFWEGVDLPGLGCRLIVIPRLPFPNYGDVLLKARKKRVADQLEEAGYDSNRASMQTWADFDLNEAIFDLKQGAGRLVRTETDMGVVAVLDKRAYAQNKGYSGKIRGALPMPVTYDLAKAKAFLGMLANRHEQEVQNG